MKLCQAFPPGLLKSCAQDREQGGQGEWAVPAAITLIMDITAGARWNLHGIMGTPSQPRPPCGPFPAHSGWLVRIPVGELFVPLVSHLKLTNDSLLKTVHGTWFSHCSVLRIRILSLPSQVAALTGLLSPVPPAEPPGHRHSLPQGFGQGSSLVL